MVFVDVLDELHPPALDQDICILGAREHNLKNISVRIPRNKLVVVTGVSGSGKSTLAFDLLFAEGQRRFLDAMSAYARQFVEQLARPDVDLISGIPPTVSIEQRNSRGGGKSTVATVTEIFHFIRLLFARLGTPHCPDCQVPLETQTKDRLAALLIKEMKTRGDLLLLAPVVRHRKGFHSDVATWALQHGYGEIRADGKIHATDRPFRLDRFREHNIEIVVGVLEKKGGSTGARTGLVDKTLALGQGTLLALDNFGRATWHSTKRACAQCGASLPELDPKLFSYNSPQGWCPTCRGFGELFYLPDVDRGARADAIEESWFEWQEGQREVCPECHGARLNKVARSVRLEFAAGLTRSNKAASIEQLGELSVAEAARFFQKLKCKGRAAEIARDILPEIRERLKFLCEVGLDYLQLGRSVPTLSGGEAQRIRLAAQLGSNLSGVLYILDEPTIGLHPRDNEQLLHALTILKERGNSLLVVEHDEETMRRADYIIDLGPGAGVHGGHVVASGTLDELLRHADSITGQALRHETANQPRLSRRPVNIGKSKQATPHLLLRGAKANNLKNLMVKFPLGRLVVVTGVSGSGKSTLVRECLKPALDAALARKPKPIASTLLEGADQLHAVYEVDQSPIGRTPRSTPATYVGFFDLIRQLFSQVPEARLRGFSPSRFSFNSAQGRCPTCEGAGTVKMEMNFLPPAYVRCESCGGTRYTRETLDIEFRGKNIAQALDMSVAEAILFFQAFPRILRPLEALRDTGLDYLKLGQISPTLSGGEAQRMKLVAHLLTGYRRQEPAELPLSNGASQKAGRLKPTGNLFILEEPTIGLHMTDVRRLVEVLQRLIEAGHSVIVIEHNLDLIGAADWIIDLGPEAGGAGGEVIAQGTPEEIAGHKKSHTGRFLAQWLRRAHRESN